MSQRGMALIAVVAVLAALLLIAIPFVVQMQAAADRSVRLLYTVRADQEAGAVLALANLRLLRTTEAAELRAAAEGKTELASPEVDTLPEYEIPESLIAAFNQNSARGRIWDVRAEDEQGKIDLRSAPFTVLASLFGAARLEEGIGADDTSLTLTDGSRFPIRNGMVRVGTELISYGSRDGGTLNGLTRGVASSAPMNSGARAWPEGELVMNASAFAIASYPILAEPGRFVPCANPLQAKRIKALGPVAIDPDDFDRISGLLTCWSGRETAGGWCNPQRLVNALKPSEEEDPGDRLVVENARYFGPGTVVRISDGKNVDYGIVLECDGIQDVSLAGPVGHDYEAGVTRVETLARHPVNVNTASDEVLVACLANVRHRVHDEAVSEATARELVPLIREAPLTSLRDWRDLLVRAEAAGILSGGERSALYYNALNPQDAWLAFGTVPFCFKSYDAVTIRATAVVNRKSAREVARRTVRRVLSLAPRWSSVSSWDTQEELERPMIEARSGRWMKTFPFNTGGWFDGSNVPPSRFVPHAVWNLWPSTGEEEGLGDVRLQPRRLRLPGVFHFDDSRHSDGYYVHEDPLFYSTLDKDVHVLGYGGAKPVAAGFWWKPYWGPGDGNRYVMDTGLRPYTNRVALLYDNDRQELIFRVADATLEPRASEIRYKVEEGRLEAETWYHVAAHAAGTKPGDLTLMVDNRAVGKAAYVTRLTEAVPPWTEWDYTKLYLDIQVEDASSFPDHGSIIIRGPYGEGIWSYESRTDTSFRCPKWGRTTNWAGWSGGKALRRIIWQWSLGRKSFADMHPAGAVVTLQGYSQPLMTDLTPGGATLVNRLGEPATMRVLYGKDTLYVPAARGAEGNADRPQGATPASAAADAVPGAGDEESPAPRGLEFRGIAPERRILLLQLGEDLKAMDASMPDEEAFRAYDDVGFGLLASVRPFEDIVPGVTIGGWEIVKYRKVTGGGGGLVLERYQSTRDVPTAKPHFVPRHDFGDPESPLKRINVPSIGDVPGVITILFPISVEATSSGPGHYLDVEDGELRAPPIQVETLYGQIDAEWFRYRYPDIDTWPHRTVFVWDEPDSIDLYAEWLSLRETNAGKEAGIEWVLNYPGGSEAGGEGGGGGPDGGGAPPEPPAPPDEGNGPEPPAPPDDEDGAAPDPGLPPVSGPQPDGAAHDDPFVVPGLPGDDEPPPPPPDPAPSAPPLPGEADPAPPDPDQGPAEPAPEPPEEPLQPPEDPAPVDPSPPGDGEAPLPPDDGTDSGEDTELPPSGDEPTSGGQDEGEPAPPMGDPPAGSGPPTQGGSEPTGPGAEPVNPLGVPLRGSDLQSSFDHWVWSLGRSTINRRAAGTRAAEHAEGADVIPTFLATTHGNLWPYYGDRVTLATTGTPVREFRVQHSWAYYDTYQPDWSLYPVAWVGFTEPPGRHYDHSFDRRDAILAETIDTRRVVRLLMFPSGELPSDLGEHVDFGSRFDGSGVSPAMFDEIRFPPDVNENVYRLGDGAVARIERHDPDYYDQHGGARHRLELKALDDESDEILIHMHPIPSNEDGLPITGLPVEGGVIRIDDELILYRKLDTATGRLEDCERGVLGTKAATHEFGSRVSETDIVIVGALQGDLDERAASIPLERAEHFPRADGCVRIDDELIGYERIAGTRLVMPEDLRAPAGVAVDPAGVKTGPGILRGRYGTVPRSHDPGAPVWFFHTRHPDRFRDRSEDPALSSLVLRKRVPDAIWKRVAWDERVPENMDVVVMVRFDGGPSWDSDRIYDVSEQLVVGGGDADGVRARPTDFLYRIDHPHGENRFLSKGGVQADFIEVRVMFRYLDGAFTTEPDAEVRSDSWKDTPWLKTLRIEYVAPVTVYRTEDVR